MRAVIRDAALNTFSKLPSPEKPQWRFRLLMRALFEAPKGTLDPVIERAPSACAH